MVYIRQLLIRCKDKSDIELLHMEVQDLAQIECIQKAVIMECINQGKYDYVEDVYDFSAMFYFNCYSDIEKYCMSPVHIKFVKNFLQKIDVAIFDYCIR